MVKKLDNNLSHFDRLIGEQLNKEISRVPGSGAAGGLGGGLMAFLGATLVKGFDMVAEAVNLEQAIFEADLVITGEGKMDRQTRFGKTPFGVAQLAKKHGKPVIGVAGTVEEGAEDLYGSGFRIIMPILEKPSDLAFAIRHASSLLERTGERIARLISLQV
jgi:glycerate kinase